MYQRIAQPVEATQFTEQHLMGDPEGLPDGVIRTGIDRGRYRFFAEHPEGRIPVGTGDWVVLEDSGVLVLTDEEFGEQYSQVDNYVDPATDDA